MYYIFFVVEKNKWKMVDYIASFNNAVNLAKLDTSTKKKLKFEHVIKAKISIRIRCYILLY